jgi:hypothetical protein
MKAVMSDGGRIIASINIMTRLPFPMLFCRNSCQSAETLIKNFRWKRGESRSAANDQPSNLQFWWENQQIADLNDIKEIVIAWEQPIASAEPERGEAANQITQKKVEAMSHSQTGIQGAGRLISS